MAERVLIIDDSWLIRQVLNKMLLKFGYEGLLAVDEKAGIDLIVSESPDCILCDLLMPDLDGFAVLEYLQTQRLKIPVVILTADIQETSRAKCIKLGAAAFLNKPPQEGEVQASIAAALEQASGEGASSGRAEDFAESGDMPSRDQMEILRELVNIGVGRGASVLNTMLSTHVRLQVPQIRAVSREEFLAEMEELTTGQLSSVRLGYEGPFSGSIQLVFSTPVAAKLVAAMVGVPPQGEDLDSLRAGTLSEVGNVVLNGVMGSISNVLGLRFSYHVPSYSEGVATFLIEPENSENAQRILLTRTQFVIEQLEANGEIVMFFESVAFGSLLDAIDAVRNDAT
jgi:chemotaxis protein CheC